MMYPFANEANFSGAFCEVITLQTPTAWGMLDVMVTQTWNSARLFSLSESHFLERVKVIF